MTASVREPEAVGRCRELRRLDGRRRALPPATGCKGRHLVEWAEKDVDSVHNVC